MVWIALVGWAAAVFFFLVSVTASKALAEAAKELQGRPPFDYDRLAQAMARHGISLSELRSQRVKAGLDKPAGWFGSHES